MRQLAAYVWKVPLCAAAHMFGVMVGGAVAGALGAAMPSIPPGAEPGRLALAAAGASLTLGLGLAPLATGLGTNLAWRSAILAWLGFVCLGVNTAIEVAIYTTVGGVSGIIVMNLFAASACAVTVAALFRPVAASTPWKDSLLGFAGQWPAAQWVPRLALAVLAFPLAYFAFGMLVGPFVVEAYRSGHYGLALPGLGRIAGVQHVRSVLFLLASLPILVAWRGSRLRLALTLGLAHFVLVGLFGMLQAYWLPAPMRLMHTAEILGDSMAYVALLVVLLVKPRTAA